MFASFSVERATALAGRSVWIFLAARSFAPKTPDYEGWISLDFLGFSRSNRDLSMGYAEITTEEFSSRFSP
jgi:hypothetical protein